MLPPLYEYLLSNKDEIEIAIKTGTFFISVITLMGTAIGGFISIRNMIADRRHKRLADFITIFSDKDPIRRLGGINGLPRYSRYLFKELFFICSVEKDDIIREMICDILQKRSPHKREECVQINENH